MPGTSRETQRGKQWVFEQTETARMVQLKRQKYAKIKSKHQEKRMFTAKKGCNMM
jgi:hypothetical protein